ncbi:MAG: type I methionyl aminopeptidase [Deltaproteobacteria bacterium]|nr:type I methionyl aminopeptidase [Deltaproteobacteria bacterium]
MIVLKSQEEIARMREAGRVVARTLAQLSRMVEPGVTTAELDREAEQLIRHCGAIPTFKGYQGFPASVCVSINEEVVHGIPSPNRLIQEGDVVSIDCGATLDGVIGDAAISVAAGKCRPRVLELLEFTKRALDAGIRASATGRRLGDISHAIEQVWRSGRLGVVREYCGHGVGHQLHEAPQVPNYGRAGVGPAVAAGWTVALEPMLNLGTGDVRVLADGWTVVTVDGKPSAHFEHTIAVTSKGPVILTLP